MLARRVLPVLALAFLMGCPAPFEEPRSPPAGLVDPADWFLLGTNLPWGSYGSDFGPSGWGALSVSAQYAEREADFAALAAAGVKVVRWFVFADGRSQPALDEAGQAQALDPLVFEDFDAAIELAAAHDVFLVPVLFDFLWCDRAQWVEGVQLGGRCATLRDPALAAALLEQAVGPLVQRYGSEPRVLAWDLFNEPIGATAVPGGAWAAETLSRARMREVLTEMAQAVRRHAGQPVTLGAASLAALQQHWRDLPLDLVQFHDYRSALLTRQLELGGDSRPHLLGEFPSSGAPVAAVLDEALAQGLGGALSWSLRGEDEASDFARDAEAMAQWAEVHAELVAIEW